MVLTRIEQAFKDLKGDLASAADLAPGRSTRIEAHIFVGFLAYCLHITLRNLARRRGRGPDHGGVLEKLPRCR